MSNRPQVLVCDQDSQSLQALRLVLQGAGFQIDTTRTAAAALSRGRLRVPDAAIIELVLPDGDGVEVCRRLREWSTMPLILLSTESDEEEQVRALEAGADDYVIKPFRPRELVARLRSNLRRAAAGGDEPRVAVNGLEVDLAAHAVRRGSEEIHLTRIEFNLLAVLVRNRGRLLTHRTLLQHVWGEAYVDDTRTLRVHIANLRRKLELGEGERVIRTDYGVGYRLADERPDRAGRSWRADESIDPEPARGCVVQLHDPARADRAGAKATSRRASNTPYGGVA